MPLGLLASRCSSIKCEEGISVSSKPRILKSEWGISILSSPSADWMQMVEPQDENRLSQNDHKEESCLPIKRKACIKLLCEWKTKFYHLIDCIIVPNYLLPVQLQGSLWCISLEEECTSCSLILSLSVCLHCLAECEQRWHRPHLSRSIKSCGMTAPFFFLSWEQQASA